MVTFKRVDIPTEYLASLCWHKDLVLDVLGFGGAYGLDGTVTRPPISRGYAYKFDSIVSHKDHAVLYESHGTKGLVIDLNSGSDLRELNRPYYHANDYNYPLALFSLPEGKEVLAHCPLEYCSLDLEDTLSGERLTKREYKSPDIFHSNLAASSDGRFLLDRGWVWHPIDVLCVYDIERALKEPTHLDTTGLKTSCEFGDLWEPETATFCGHKLVFSSFHEGPLDDDMDGPQILMAEEGVLQEGPIDDKKVRRVVASELEITDKDGNPVNLGDTRRSVPDTQHLLQVFDLDSGKLLSSRQMPEFLGRMMAVGDRHVLSLHDHPKLIEIMTGKVVQRWEDLFAGPETFQPSVMTGPKSKYFFAPDSAHNRFAIGKDGQVSIVSLVPS
jgi:hypothetical protein